MGTKMSMAFLPFSCKKAAYWYNEAGLRSSVGRLFREK